MNDFFKNEKELVANAGRAYTKLQGYNSEQSLWTLLLQASDECAVPACGGSWYSNGRYEEIQTNKIPPANKLLTRGWNWIFNGIAACNEIIYETEPPQAGTAHSSEACKSSVHKLCSESYPCNFVYALPALATSSFSFLKKSFIATPV